VDVTIAREFRSSVEEAILQRTKTELAQLRIRHEEDLQIQNVRFKAALENMGDGLAMFDADELLVVCNGRFGRMYHLPTDLQKIGTPFREIIRYQTSSNFPRDQTVDLAVAEKLAAFSQLPRGFATSRIDELSDGRSISVTRQPLEGGGWVSTHTDVTDRRRDEAKISFLAHHDPLTGLPNRAFFTAKMENAAGRLHSDGEPFAILMIDLDEFKNVNDTHGHPAGDELLKETARRLKLSIRETDVLARLGGDEFAIIQLAERRQRKGASELAERIVDIVSEPYTIQGQTIFVGISIGIALAPDDANEWPELLKLADLALYATKSAGRNGYRLFDITMQADKLLAKVSQK
jgi:diguanylate cyclase (GGDEF)-like protein